MLNFSCVKEIKTVYTVLDEHGALDVLRDDLITVATKEIYSEGRMRRDIQKDIKLKERAIEALAARYERSGLPAESIRQCLYSIGDNHAFLRASLSIMMIVRLRLMCNGARDQPRPMRAHDHLPQGQLPRYSS